MHKIFDNLIIISNKAKPKSIEIEVIGDVYDFKKSGLLKETEFKNEKTTIKYDPILNQKTLVTEQECRDIEKVGRRMGNIHYKHYPMSRPNKGDTPPVKQPFESRYW